MKAAYAALGVLLAVLTFCAGIITGIAIAGHAPADSQLPTLLLPCPTEDSTGCYWDADSMGNRLGNDVVTAP